MEPKARRTRRGKEDQNEISPLLFFAFFAPSRFPNVTYAFGFLGFRVSLPPLSFLPMRYAPFTFLYHRTFRRAMQRLSAKKRAMVYFFGCTDHRRRS